MMTLVLLPGMDGTGTLFAPFIQALGKEFDVKIVAYPNMGPQGYAELESIARAAIPVTGPYVILGESFSGPTAISIAASHPARLVGLVLCCTFASNPLRMLLFLKPILYVLPIGILPFGILNYFLLGSFSTRELRDSLANSLAAVSPSTLRARLRAIFAVDVTAKLANVDIPILCLRATRDRLVPTSATPWISTNSANIEVKQIEAPHLLLQATPSKTAQIVSNFIHRLNQSPSQ